MKARQWAGRSGLRCALMALMASVAGCWKNGPPPDSCASWCKWDDGKNGKPDACTAAFKRDQCQGCDRCKEIKRAQEEAKAENRCKGCCTAAGGMSTTASSSSPGAEPALAAVASQPELDAARQEAAQLRVQLEQLQREVARLKDEAAQRSSNEEARRDAETIEARKAAAGLKKAQAAYDAAGEARRRAEGERDQARAAEAQQAALAAQRAQLLASLRENQPQAYAVAVLNAAPEQALRNVRDASGKRIGQVPGIIGGRPWYRDNRSVNFDRLRGSQGGVHGVGDSTIFALQSWAEAFVL